MAVPAVAKPQRESALPPVEGIAPDRRADIPRPPNTRVGLQLRVVLGVAQQLLGGVVAAFDPVRSTREGEMAVAVDHARHDRGAAGVDHFRVAGILFRVGRTDPCDAAALDKHAHAELEPGRAPIGQRRVAIERAQRSLISHK